MYLFAFGNDPFTVFIFAHALFILSFIFRLVNRKSANSANYLQNNNNISLN